MQYAVFVTMTGGIEREKNVSPACAALISLLYFAAQLIIVTQCNKADTRADHGQWTEWIAPTRLTRLDLTCLWRKIRLIGDPEAKTWHIMRRQSFCAICGKHHKQRHRQRTTSLHTTVSFVTYCYRTHALLWVEHIRHIVVWVYIFNYVGPSSSSS